MLLGVVSANNSYGMEFFQDTLNSLGSALTSMFEDEVQVTSMLEDKEQVTGGANTTMHTVGSKLHTVIQAPKITNSVKCPMGVSQTLALLQAISEERIQTEITQFTGDAQIGDNTANLNSLLVNSKPYEPEHKWDKRKFEFSNGVYALMAEQIKLNKGYEPKFTALGAQLIGVDFSNPTEAAAKLNGIVDKDTRGKIKEILSADSFTADSIFVLLHTLYVNASWQLPADETHKPFTNLSGKKKTVKSFEIEEYELKFTQKNGVNLISLPTVGGCNLTIRHCKNNEDLRPITEGEIASLMGEKPEYVRYFSAPAVSMKADLNLKTILGDHLPQILNGAFQTELTSERIEIADYIQKVTFDMTSKGVEASAATVIHAMLESCSMSKPKKGPEIRIDSAFSFALTKNMNGVDYLLFQGQVVDHEVMSDDKNKDVFTWFGETI